MKYFEMSVSVEKDLWNTRRKSQRRNLDTLKEVFIEKDIVEVLQIH